MTADITVLSSTSSMYRVGDYVYFENSQSGTYAIRRIEELNKTQNGTVEARVMCFYRRNEIPANLLPLSDKHHWGEVDMEQDSDDEDYESTERISRNLQKQREVFLSRQVETLPATLIRGRCSVTLLSEVESISSYTSREDAFFYSLVYDPHMKTLQADRGSIRIGSEFQAEIPAMLKPGEVEEEEEIKEEEEMLWQPNNKLKADEIDKFILLSRSVGTFARALDCSSSVKQPSLHMSAAAASRDITVFHAYQALHAHRYDMSSALASLVPATGPVLCRDEMEDWSSAEASLFEEAIEKYGKDFNDIKRDFLPWKSMKNIIEYFFMWKTTDRYVQQKKIKALENESKLKQVYVPAYNRKASRISSPHGEVMVLGKDCDAYPNMSKYSWSEYKKYGRYIPATTTEDCFIVDKANNPRYNQMRGSQGLEQGKVGKTRAAFYLRTTPLTRASRRTCPNLVNIKHQARKPTNPIDVKSVKSEGLPELTDPNRIRNLCTFKKHRRRGIPEICKQLGQTDTKKQDWLVIGKGKSPKPAKEAFPRPAQRPDGSFIYEKIVAPNSGAKDGSGVNSMGNAGTNSDQQPTPPSTRHQVLYKKRPYEEKPGSDGTSVSSTRGGKLIRGGGTQTRTYSVNQVTPKGKLGPGQKPQHGASSSAAWQDAPDDLFYRASPNIKKMRKQTTTAKLRRAARKPFAKVLSQNLN